MKLSVVALMGGVFMLRGCNTMSGLGKDVGKMGGKIEAKAEEKK